MRKRLPIKLLLILLLGSSLLIGQERPLLEWQSLQGLLEQERYEELFEQSEARIRTVGEIPLLLYFSGAAQKGLEELSVADATFLRYFQAHEEVQATIDSFHIRALLMYGQVLEGLGQLTDAEATYQQGINTLPEVFSEDHILLPLLLTNIGSVQESLGNFSQAEKSYQEGETVFQKLYPNVQHPKIGDLYNNMAVLYRMWGKYQPAEDYYLQALETYESFFPPEHFNFLKVNYNMAVMLSDIGDYGKSERYLQRTFRIAEEVLPEGHPIFANLHEVAGYIQVVFDRFSHAIEHFEKAIALREIDREDDPFSLVQTYALAAEPYFMLEDYRAVGSYLKKAEQIFVPIREEFPLTEAQLLYLRARWHEGRGSYSKALENYRNARQIESGIVGQNHPDALDYANDIGLLQLKMQQPDKALASFDHLLKHYEGAGSSYARFLEWDVALTASSGAASAHLQRYRKYGNPTDLEAAIGLHEQTLEGINQTLRQANSTASLTGTNTEARQLVTAALKTLICADSQGVAAAHFDLFTAIEFGKALSLTSSKIRHREDNIPGEQKAKEENLKQKIEQLQTDLLWAMEDDDQGLIKELQGELFSSCNQLEELQDNLFLQYPNYRNWQYPTYNIPELSTVQAALSPQQAWLSYFMTDEEELFVAKVTRVSVAYFHLKPPTGLRDRVQEYHRLLQSYPQWKDAPLAKYQRLEKRLSELGHGLYENLWQPIGELPSEVLICADDLLWLLPFESLTTTMASTPSYLLEQHQIIYNYSAAWWLLTRELPVAPQHVLAFAPSFGALSEGELAQLDRSFPLKDLAFTTKEVDQIATYFPLLSFINQTATKQAFKDHHQRASIIHFATHALLDSVDHSLNYLAFHPEQTATRNWKLPLQEVLQYKLQADLVVLSSCHSGGGPLLTGEGLASLARAFSYAGTRSVVTSLWALNDQASAEIMGHFYEYLADGASKAEALQQARLRYINEQADATRAHPYYWSALVGFGDPGVLNSNKGGQLFWWLGGLLICMFAFLLLRRRA